MSDVAIALVLGLLSGWLLMVESGLADWSGRGWWLVWLSVIGLCSCGWRWWLKNWERLVSVAE